MKKITSITATVLASLLCVFNFALPGTALAEKLAPSAGEDETALSISRNGSNTRTDEQAVSTDGESPHFAASASANDTVPDVAGVSFWTKDHAIALARLLL